MTWLQTEDLPMVMAMKKIMGMVTDTAPDMGMDMGTVLTAAMVEDTMLKTRKKVGRTGSHLKRIANS